MEQAACFCDSLNVLDVLLLLFVSVTDPHGFSITFTLFQIETDPSRQSTSRSFPEPVYQEEEGKKESNNQVIDVQDAFWEKLKLAVEKKAGAAEAQRFCKAFQEIHRKLLNSGKVVAVGPGARDKDGKLIPVTLKEGETVLLPEYGGTEARYVPLRCKHDKDQVCLTLQKMDKERTQIWSNHGGGQLGSSMLQRRLSYVVSGHLD
ncbi:hypothetical protein D5086_002467 [Populus alba]|uniref:Uncharacterized protein n=1 Tax=Populus alba TaxID=43335 RepID=A0ACC4D1L7_POPAL